MRTVHLVPRIERRDGTYKSNEGATFAVVDGEGRDLFAVYVIPANRAQDTHISIGAQLVDPHYADLFAQALAEAGAEAAIMDGRAG